MNSPKIRNNSKWLFTLRLILINVLAVVPSGLFRVFVDLGELQLMVKTRYPQAWLAGR